MASNPTREATSDGVPTAKFLQGMLHQFFSQRTLGHVIFCLLKFGACLVLLPADVCAARVTALSTTLIKRLENIFAVALDDTAAQTSGGNAPAPPSLTETSVQQFQLDVESTAVIRAAEEIMMLTRTMKEIWLFGGLDTLAADHEGKDVDGQDGAAQRKMEEDVRIVEEGFRKFLEKYETTLGLDGGKE
jgi:RecB family endonuclease NucS